MFTFAINSAYGDARTVKADGYVTEGDFVDFKATDTSNRVITVLRLRAAAVYTIELENSESVLNGDIR